MLLHEGGAGHYLGIALHREYVGLVEVEVLFIQNLDGIRALGFHVVGLAPAGNRTPLLVRQGPGAAGNHDKALGAVAVLQHLDAGIAVHAHEHGLADANIVPGSITFVQPDFEVTPGGPDHRHYLFVVNVLAVLAPIADPVPVGLVGQHGGLLGRLVQDAKENEFVHVRQGAIPASLEVGGVLVKLLLIDADACSPPDVGAGTHAKILEHGLFSVFQEPLLVEHERGGAGQGQHRRRRGTIVLQVQGMVVQAAGILYIEEAEVGTIGTGGNAFAGNPRLKGETSILTDERLAVVPGNIVVEIESGAGHVIVNGPALGQVGNDLRVVVRAVRNDAVVRGAAQPGSRSGGSTPGVGVLQRVFIVYPERAAVNRFAVESCVWRPIFCKNRRVLGTGHHFTRRLCHDFRHRGGLRHSFNRSRGRGWRHGGYGSRGSGCATRNGCQKQHPYNRRDHQSPEVSKPMVGHVLIPPNLSEHPSLVRNSARSLTRVYCRYPLPRQATSSSKIRHKQGLYCACMLYRFSAAKINSEEYIHCAGACQ